VDTTISRHMAVYRILGHANAALSIILDSLYSRHGDTFRVEIISNIDAEQNEYANLEYNLGDIMIEEFHYTCWTPSAMSHFILGGMSPRTKKIIYELFLREFQINAAMYSSVCHAQITLCNGVHFGHGCNFSPGVTVAPYAKIGNFVTLNRHVSIGHHTQIEDYCTINPAANIAGICVIREGAQIGMGANVLDRVEIGANAIVGAGSLVTKDVPPGTVVYGVPARAVRDRNQ
jgi:sugar O-acyltransferase (sialic acid O-acetyltransferase NeuD family)